MALSADALRAHLDYNTWASRRLVEAAGQLSPEELTRDFQTADKSILGTLVHVFAADRIWLARLTKQTPGPFISDADYHLAVLQNDWPALQDGWREWAAGLTDEAAQESITYRRSATESYAQPAWQLVMHVVNHGTHHRGQVSGFLRTLGHTPPPLDLVLYHRQKAAGA
jgi:uncharacterized damage-inducible protein DinB